MTEAKCPTVRFEEIMHEELGANVKMSHAIDDAPIDSLEYVAFIQRLEKEFSVTLKDEEVTAQKHFYDLCLLVTGVEPAIPTLGIPSLALNADHLRPC